MSFRPMQDGDVEPVVALWTLCGLVRPWNDPYRDIAFARGKANSEILVAECCGLIAASVLAGHDGHRGMLYYVAVHPDWRRRGLGRAAVRAAEHWLTARGVWKINLMIRSENEQVRGFYESLGYETTPVFAMGRKIAQE